MLLCVAVQHLPSTKNKFVVETQGGRRLVSVDEFVEVVQLLKPEVVVPMADEINSSFAPNRQRAAVQSSLDWLDACITAGINTPPSPSSPSSTPSTTAASLLCGVIVGGNEERLRRLSTVETCKRNVQAVLISGLDSCENETTRNEMLDIVVSEITPSTLPRLLSGIGHPLQVVNAVGRGIDAFVSPYPATVTKNGSAMVFWIDSEVDDTRERTNERKLSGSLLHLREPRFAKDTKPLLADCECFACQQKYSRAYIHHLLNVREMLGDVLLYMHNMHHYYRFFATMRQTIDAGAFESFAQSFTSQYEEKESTAPPLAIPLAILERRQQLDVEKKALQEARKAKAGKKAAKEKAKHE